MSGNVQPKLVTSRRKVAPALAGVTRRRTASAPNARGSRECAGGPTIAQRRATMRSPISSVLVTVLVSISVVGCTNTPSGAPDIAASVRERLEMEEARLWIAPIEIAGVITAERRTSEAWTGASVDLGIENGELIVSAEGEEVIVEGFQLAFAPLRLPEGLFGGQTAELTGVRIDLAEATRAPGAWTGENAARFTAALDLAIHWTLELDGVPAPLGSPALPPVPVEVTLMGDGATVAAELRLHAAGELWNWAGLVRLSELQLGVEASLR